MQVVKKIVLLISAGLLLAGPVRLLAGKGEQPSSSWEYDFHSAVPLGSDCFVLKGEKSSIVVMATAITPEMDGWRRVGDGRHSYVFTAEGKQPHQYPQDVQFRVTASGRADVPSDADPLKVTSGLPLNDYLLGLHFQIRVFHALHVQVVKPADVRVIGVPADVPYNERIYKVSFRLPRIPVTDRMLLEVLSPEGERLARFHFELL
jgi:hypothetical protein